MATIGIMSSINYEKSFQDALENNVNVSGVSFHHPAEDNATDLVQAVKNLLAAKVDYIVTLGGYIAYSAAATTSTVPFFSLTGEIPTMLAAKCWGGVSLESWAHNKDRVEYLIGQGYNTETAISLYYNQNSGLATDEVNDWTNNLYPNYKTAGSGYVLVQNPITAMKSKKNDENDFDTTADNILSGAVIVSPDPFFHEKHDKLVGKLNKKTLYVCYPLQNYADAKPKKGSAVLYGPKLEDAITTLAGLINSALTKGTGVGFSTQPLGNPNPVV
jgi:hypothetical protein